MNKIVYIPVEMLKRELNSRLLIALQLLKNEYKVVIGKQSELKYLVKNFPKGIYLAKSSYLSDINTFKLLKKNEYKIIVCDEEGLVNVDAEKFVSTKLIEENLNLIDIYLNWGIYDNTIALKHRCKYKNKFKITGNARIDLLRSEFEHIYSKECEEITNKFGKFILIPSVFSMVNNQKGKMFEKQWLSAVNAGTLEEKKFFRDLIEYYRELFHLFVNMIHKLANDFSDINIVVRPHPTENIDFWKKEFKSYKNIFIEFSGIAIPWIKSASVIIHNGSTTGIEATILKKNIITYQPIENEMYNFKLPNSIGYNVINYEELCKKVLMLLSENNPKKEYIMNGYSGLSNYIDSLEKDFAHEKIVSICDDIAINSEKIIPKFRKKDHIKYYKNEYFYNLKNIIKKILSLHFDFSNYGKQKFPGLKEEDVRNFIDKIDFNDIKNKDLKITKVFNNTFLLEKSNQKRDGV